MSDTINNREPSSSRAGQPVGISVDTATGNVTQQVGTQQPVETQVITPEQQDAAKG